jgi:NitT/TauT family transport system permease protein
MTTVPIPGTGPLSSARVTSRSQRILLARLALVVLILVGWETTSGTLYDVFWVSKPSQIIGYIHEWISSGDFFTHLWATMSATLAGFASGAALGLAAGMVLSRMDFIAKVLDPFLVAINGIPRVALAPLFVVWFGIGILPKIALVFTLVFFVIFYNTYTGVQSVERHHLDLAWVMGAGERVLFRKVILPAAMPYIFLGIKLSIPYALIGAIIGEFVASSEGLGWKIQMETSLYNTTGTMAGLVILMSIVILINMVLSKLEARLLRWRPTQRNTDAGVG